METKDLMYKRAYVWDKLNAEERKACMDMGEDYKAFLNESKTERRCAAEIIRETGILASVLRRLMVRLQAIRLMMAANGIHTAAASQDCACNGTIMKTTCKQEVIN